MEYDGGGYKYNTTVQPQIDEITTSAGGAVIFPSNRIIVSAQIYVNNGWFSCIVVPTPYSDHDEADYYIYNDTIARIPSNTQVYLAYRYLEKVID